MNFGYYPEKIAAFAICGGAGFLLGGPTAAGLSSSAGMYLINARWDRAKDAAAKARQKIWEKKQESKGNKIISFVACAVIATIALNLQINARTHWKSACSANPASDICSLVTWVGWSSAASLAISSVGMIFIGLK